MRQWRQLPPVITSDMNLQYLGNPKEVEKSADAVRGA